MKKIIRHENVLTLNLTFFKTVNSVIGASYLDPDAKADTQLIRHIAEYHNIPPLIN